LDFVIGPGQVDTTSLAAFGQIDYSLTETLELTAGIRHTRDEKDIFRELFLSVFETVVLVDDTTTFDDSWEKTTGKLGLNYRVNDDVLLYASYSLGFKAGGFNASSLEEPSYEPELLDAYEIGMKGQFLDNHLQLNISAFYYDYTDKTESKIDLIGDVASTIFTNAGAATIAGIEVEMQSRLTDAFSIDGSLAYQNAEYDEFDSQDPSNAALGVQDLAGNQLTRSPELKFHLGAQYEWQLDDGLGSLTARADFSWVDEQYFRAFNLETDKADSYHRTNVRLQWDSSDTHWQAELYVLNLEDDYILSNLVVAGPNEGFGRVASYLDPRTYGVEISYRF